MALLNYTTVEYADAYIEPLELEEWNGLDATEKERFLILGTRYITQNFKLVSFDDDVIPDAVQDATCEAAIALAKGQDLLSPIVTDTPLEKLKADVVELTFNKDNIVMQPKLPAIENLLKGYISPSTNSFTAVSLKRV